jgi:Thiol-disulfide isomerase and thioredoxins
MMRKKAVSPLICSILSMSFSISAAMAVGGPPEKQLPPISETQVAATTVWAPSSVPVDDWDAFFLFYQRFLYERMFREVRKINDKSQDHAAKIENHRELSATLEKLSEVCGHFARTGGFPAQADPAIKKEDKNKIPGTWNLYRNVPINALDLWQESCCLRFLALLHESEIDFDQLHQASEYANQLAKHDPLQQLSGHVKRAWAAKTLERISQFADRANEPCDARLNAQNAGPGAFADAIADYHAFLMVQFDRDHFDRKNIEVLEKFVNTAELCHTEKIRDLLYQVLFGTEEAILRYYAVTQNDPAATRQKVAEVAEMLELLRLDLGMLRRQDLIGQALQIRGHDITGRPFDAASLEGKVVLLDFWATWCAPCVAEFPHLETLYKKYREQGFEIISYNVDTDMEQLSAFLEKKPLAWPVLVREKTLEKGEPPLSTFYGAKKLPVVILRDRQGKVVLLDARGKALEETLERLFE